jgi:AcrR family transcriptional regulator
MRLTSLPHSTIVISGPPVKLLRFAGMSERPIGLEPPRDARSRILEAAYELFSARGVRGVGIDAIIERSGVARMTLYRHFGSKDELVLAFLELREEQWTRRWLQAEVERRASAPADRLLAVFDVFDEWFRRPDFEGCAFINVMLETADDADSTYRATVSYLAGIRHFLEGLARQAGIPNADNFARQWHILMKGSIVAAGEGDAEAARRAQDIARLLLSQHLPATLAG